MYWNNNATRTRREVLIRIAQAFFDDALEDRVDRIPIEMNPRPATPTRCCVHKDRAVVKYRCMAALGMRVEEETDELKHLSEYAAEALERSASAGPILTVIAEACTACVRSRYQVTNACRGCLARPCVMNCPRQAIKIENGQAVIDPDACINCGLCVKVCPYHAVIRVPIPCEEACPVGAIQKDEYGKEMIDYDKCIFCGKCMRACPFGAIMERSQIVDVLQAIKSSRRVAALPAPSIVGQFSSDIGHIAAALKALGFDEVLEVAAGADITAVKEAQELVERMESGRAMMTTSCCPAYVEAVKKHVPELHEFVSHTPTPMHFTAEQVKRRSSDTVTVFIGPCVAKRHEALSDLEVDYVLTFEELGALFVAKEINVEDCEPISLASPAFREGRGFAVSGGVAGAVKSLVGDRIDVRCESVDGLSKKSLRLLRSYAKGRCPGNMIEVMACEGGCIAGPGALANPAKAAKEVAVLVAASPELAPNPVNGVPIAS